MEAARVAANNLEWKKAGLMKTFAEKSMLLGAMPISTIAGLAYKWNREGALPGAAFRAPNTGYTESAGVTTELFESVKFCGGDLDVDNAYVVAGGPDVRTKHEMMKATAIAQKLGYSLVKGSVTNEGSATADANGINGLQARYGMGFGGSAVNTAVATSNQLVTNNGASNALSIAKLDETIMKVDGCNALLMAKKCAINLTTLLRNSASITTSRDEFGRVVTSYNGIPILYADINGDQAALAFDEGASSNTTSVYAMNLSDDGLHLIQAGGGMQVTDLGQIPDKPVWRTRMEWYLGLVDEHPRCVARLHTIADLAAVLA